MRIRRLAAGLAVFAFPGLAFAQSTTVEGLGSGLRAASESNWFGLRSKTWGTLAFGRFDLHARNRPTANVVRYAPPAANWQVGWTNWRLGPDEFAAADQRGDRLWAYYGWGGFRLGLAWDHAKLISGATGLVTSDRTAWAVPMRYTTGSHSFHLEYRKAHDDRATAAADGVRVTALGYSYDLSKRTSLGLTYTRGTSDASAFYHLYNWAAGPGSPSAGVAAGEDPRIWSFGLRHAF